MAVKLGNGNWAVKENKLLAYNDNSGRFFNKEFDFARGSSATYVAKDGLIKSAASDVPRIDFSDSTNGALLLEPQRTNLIPYSEDFSVANWIKSNATITSNSIISPDGTSNADKLVENSSTSAHQVYDAVITNSGDYSNSIFVKSAERSKIRINSGSNSYRVDFDLSNGTVISQLGATGNIVSVSNGWYKCDISWNTATVSAQYFLISLLDDSGTQQYQGDGTSGVYIWGAQLEEGSYATSYIPSLSGSATTRLADVCNNSGSAQDFNSEEGVLYAEISALADDGTYRQILLHDNAYVDRIALRYMPTSNQINVYLINGTPQVDFTYNLSSTLDFIKIAFKYKQNDFSLWVNGIEVGVDTSGTTFSANTLQKIDFDFTNNYFFYGNIKDLQVFTEAKSDEFLAALTTI